MLKKIRFLIFLKKMLRNLLKMLRNLLNDTKAIGSGENLNKLAEIYGTDKGIGHFYTPHYATHLERFRNKKINLL